MILTNELLFLLNCSLLALGALGSLLIAKEALITFVAICSIAANLFVLKQIDLFGLSVTASDAFMIGATLGINLLREFCSKHDAYKALIISMLAMSGFTIIGLIQLLFIPNNFDTAHTHLMVLLQPTARIVIASLFSYFLSQHIDYRLFSYAKHRLAHIPFMIRSGVCTMLSQSIDTLCFTFLGLYGLVGNISNILMLSFIIKLLSIVIMNPLVSLASTLFKKEQAL